MCKREFIFEILHHFRIPLTVGSLIIYVKLELFVFDCLNIHFMIRYVTQTQISWKIRGN